MLHFGVNHQSLKQAKMEAHRLNVHGELSRWSVRSCTLQWLVLLKQHVSSWLLWPGGPTAAVSILSCKHLDMLLECSDRHTAEDHRQLTTYIFTLHRGSNSSGQLSWQKSNIALITFLKNVCATQLCVKGVPIKWFMTLLPFIWALQTEPAQWHLALTVLKGMDSRVNHTHSLIQVRIFFLRKPR